MSPTPAWKRSRPAPRNASGRPQQISDTVTWTRIVQPRERYRIVYQGGDGERTERVIDLAKLGSSDGTQYLSVIHAGRPKTFRADRVVEVLEQLTEGHPPSIFAALTYSSVLPSFPVAGAVFKAHTIAVSTRTWTVDLNAYTCTCPEKRIRGGKGYKPGQLGYVCPHMARAIFENLPAESGHEWTDALRSFLSDPRKIHIDNLS